MAKSADDLRRERKAAADKMEQAAVAMSDAADDAALATAKAAFDQAEADYKRADALVNATEAAEAAKARAAVPAAHVTQPGAAAPAQPLNPEHKAIEVGFIMAALGSERGDQTRAAAKLEKDGYSQIGAILNSATSSAGGITIPLPQTEALIELLTARTVVRRAGARVFNMPAGKIRMAKQTGRATATYGAELAATAPSEPTFGNLDQAFKKLTAFVPVSNDLIRQSSVRMAMVVRDDLVNVMALREDLAFLRGDGLSNTPKGIRNWAPVANWSATGVAKTAAAAETALRGAVSKVEDADVAMLAGAWFMRAAAKNWIASLKDAVSGATLFPMVEDGELLGYPIYTTSQIPNNLGAGTNETEIYFADMSEMMIGDAMQLQLAVSTEAAYVDAGTTHSAFQKDMTLFRAISEHDFAPAHDAAIAGCNGIGWSL